MKQRVHIKTVTTIVIVSQGFNMKYVCFFLILFVGLAMSEVDPKCSQPIDPGICFGYSEMYGFDVTTQECKKFIYGGCQGNDNRFYSLEECQNNCQV
ncbi:unnamed protein product [Arctia plantaginis]|uniref:BPTI/Kunitz inhibitor domain-containing protein n=1 Tax=Arctia plantaginis TaxID=874455 RepID=A0A8S1BSX9_ARCPL|nr:unnamed protein product [Arctia plantaginis]